MPTPPEQKCPICGKAAPGYHDVEWGIGTLEEGYDCPEGHWSYQYAYGNSEETIGNEIWCCSYSVTDDELRRIRFAIEVITKISKEEWERGGHRDDE